MAAQGFVGALSRGTADQKMGSMPKSNAPANWQSQVDSRFKNNIREYDPSKPWEYTYLGAAQANHEGGHSGVRYKPTWEQQGGYGGAVLMDGPQGWGVYSTGGPQAQLHRAQSYFADQFRENMPQMQGDLSNQLAGSVNAEMGQNIKNLDQSNSRRGLLYGGVSAGQEAGARTAAAAKLARGRGAINQGLLDSAQQMEGGAIKSGFDIQRQKQAMADAIYQKAMAEATGTGAMVGDVLGAAGAVVGGIYGGYAGGAAGYAGGQAVGHAIA